MTNLEIINKHFGKIIRKKVIKNFVAYKGEDTLYAKYTYSRDLRGFMEVMFIWDATPEGHKYWCKKANAGREVRL
jgi:hypothetical protein